MFTNEGIRIGTLVNKGEKNPEYIRQIVGYGFESFSITFWKTLGNVDLVKLADGVRAALDGTGAVISSIGVFGNPLETGEEDVASLRGWEALIDHAHLFGTDLVCGFTGRLRGKSIDESIPRFKEVFGELASRAAGKGVRLAFENCNMGGNWKTGDWNIAHNPDAWKLMFDAVPQSNLGLQWEPCHQMVSLIDPIPQLREWAPKVFHVHGKDATILWDVVRKHGIGGNKTFAYHRTPGFGDSNWTDIITILRQSGYKGTIDIEGWHDPVYKADLEMTGQVRGLNYLKECRGGSFVANPVV
ncbi:MAG: sugar phosphate isomerase/epimerase [Lentisphaeria bacterium]|jgi:sugar phosphate isomerase/epimerase|nr:sugar phosphate isomerase/epimerase [Lentisphaeria bacterium]